jgi:hypothetical protein
VEAGTPDAPIDGPSSADVAPADRRVDEPSGAEVTSEGGPGPGDAGDGAPDAAGVDGPSPDASDGSLGDSASDAAPVRDGADGGDGGATAADTSLPVCRESTPAVPPPCAPLGVAVDPYYAGSYACHDLGPVPGVPPTKYGGLVLTLGNCSTELLIGGEANNPSGKLYRVQVTRDGAGHINGFSGTATAVIDAPYNDGGVVFGPGGVLFVARWPANQLQQTKPGSAIADKVIDLQALGVAHSSASLNFVPDPLPGVGALKLASWATGQWYTVEYRPDGNGTYDLVSAKHVLTVPGGPEGFVYVQAGSRLFPTHSLLVSEWTANKIASYEVDDSADPKLATRRDFITGLHGAEGAFRDPVTGDFFFSTWGQAADRVIVVRGFAPIRQ